MIKKRPDIENIADFLQENKINSVLIGPALGKSNSSKHLILKLIEHAQFLTLDADALSVFADNIEELADALQNRKANKTVLTPHYGEFLSLFPDKNGNKLEQTKAAAKHYNSIIVHKGSDTVIADSEGNAVINIDAPPSLAKAGTGDVLAGIIAAKISLGSKKINIFDAVCASVRVHSLQAAEIGNHLIAEDLF